MGRLVQRLRRLHWLDWAILVLIALFFGYIWFQIDGALTAYSGIMSYQLQDSAKFAYELPTGGLEFAVVMNSTLERS